MSQIVRGYRKLVDSLDIPEMIDREPKIAHREEMSKLHETVNDEVQSDDWGKGKLTWAPVQC
jgi:hypothetical protein